MSDRAARPDGIFVHSTADVADGARIGAGTTVCHPARARYTGRVGAGPVIGAA